MLIGLPDLAKERKLSKIVINRRLPNINITYLFLSKGAVLHFFYKLDKLEIDCSACFLVF